MALMERVATLLRANLNDLLDRAEDPEKMAKQLVLDMENQLLQLKTQVAMALADGHLLEKKVKEQEAAVADWHRKAELAVSKQEDALARAALERGLGHERTLAAYQAQAAEQAAEAETLRGTFVRLQGKLAETREQCELLLLQHRRARLATEASGARAAVEQRATGAAGGRAFGRLRAQIDEAEAQHHAAQQVLADGSAGNLEDRLAALEVEDRVEQRLLELKSKGQRMLAGG